VSPVTHFFTGWVLGSVVGSDKRERALVTLAAVSPDVDGLGIIPELLTRQSRHPLVWFSQYHHDLHTLLFAIVVSLLAFILTERRWTLAIFAFISFHLHLAEDLVGSRGLTHSGGRFHTYFLLAATGLGAGVVNGRSMLGPTWHSLLR
jgi:LexA-binding, inner membrane-associated putative hydrolase